MTNLMLPPALILILGALAIILAPKQLRAVIGVALPLVAIAFA